MMKLFLAGTWMKLSRRLLSSGYFLWQRQSPNLKVWGWPPRGTRYRIFVNWWPFLWVICSHDKINVKLNSVQVIITADLSKSPPVVKVYSVNPYATVSAWEAPGEQYPFIPAHHSDFYPTCQYHVPTLLTGEVCIFTVQPVWPAKLLKAFVLIFLVLRILPFLWWLCHLMVTWRSKFHYYVFSVLRPFVFRVFTVSGVLSLHSYVYSCFSFTPLWQIALQQIWGLWDAKRYINERYWIMRYRYEVQDIQ